MTGMTRFPPHTHLRCLPVRDVGGQLLDLRGQQSTNIEHISPASRGDGYSTAARRTPKVGKDDIHADITMQRTLSHARTCLQHLCVWAEQAPVVWVTQGLARRSRAVQVFTSSQAAAHSPVVPDSHCSLALSMAVSTADLSVVCVFATNA